MKKILFPFLLLLLSVACDDDTPAPQTPFTPIVINFDMIGSGELAGPSSSDIAPGNYVITNQNDWNILLSKMNILNNTTGTFNTNVNFDEYTVIAAFDLLRSGGSWTISVTSIIENENEINVSVVRSGAGGLINPVRQAFQLVKMPINPKPIVFN